jgi:hypothetical protein
VQRDVPEDNILNKMKAIVPSIQSALKHVMTLKERLHSSLKRRFIEWARPLAHHHHVARSKVHASVGCADCFPEPKTPYDILCRHAVFALLSNLRGYQMTQPA